MGGNGRSHPSAKRRRSLVTTGSVPGGLVRPPGGEGKRAQRHPLPPISILALAAGVLLVFTPAHAAVGRSVSLLFPPLASPLPSPPPEPCGPNLLGNPGFESGTEGWYVEQGVEAVPSDPHTGELALRLGASDRDAYADQVIPAVRPGVAYTLAGWGKVSASGESGEIGLTFRDGAGNRLREEEPEPLLFGEADYELRALTFTPSSRIAEVSVYLWKGAGSARFSADDLSLEACGEPATPAPASPASPPPATPESELTEYVDPDGGFAVGYPSGWRRLSEEEVRAQLGPAEDRAAEAALASVAFVAASPDGRASVALTKLRAAGPGEGALEAVVGAVRAANAASVAGIGEVDQQPAALGGVAAVRLTYAAADPATGAAGGRLVRQVIATRGGSAVVLTFVVRAEHAAAFEAAFRRIEESWRWRP